VAQSSPNTQSSTTEVQDTTTNERDNENGTNETSITGLL